MRILDKCNETGMYIDAKKMFNGKSSVFQFEVITGQFSLNKQVMGYLVSSITKCSYQALILRSFVM